MNLPEKYASLLSGLREIAGPIIRFRIDKELFGNSDVLIDEYIASDDRIVDYWFSVLRKNCIHGRNDYMYENAIAKLLEYGFTKEHSRFDATFRYILDETYWKGELWEPIVIYPFLIRAGYGNIDPVQRFFDRRLRALEQTVSNIGYDFQDQTPPKQAKYRGKFIFTTDFETAPLPSIYDVYAWAFYPNASTEMIDRIERLIAYLLDERFQRIPREAYLYARAKKRYYAAGSVYHACLDDYRKLLNIYLFSHFHSIATHAKLMDNIRALLQHITDEGFFLFDKTLLQEKKDMYFIYSGGHMGLGENRRLKTSRMVESTFWMLKILSNLHQQNIAI